MFPHHDGEYNSLFREFNLRQPREWFCDHRKVVLNFNPIEESNKSFARDFVRVVCVRETSVCVTSTTIDRGKMLRSFGPFDDWFLWHIDGDPLACPRVVSLSVCSRCCNSSV